MRANIHMVLVRCFWLGAVRKCKIGKQNLGEQNLNSGGVILLGVIFMVITSSKGALVWLSQLEGEI
jgi:hypothetical protein